MSDEFKRYAVYWVPGHGDGLAQFGTSWMGWCAEKGEPRSRHVIAGLTADIAAATRRVALHGFHGVLRAPFRIGAGHSRWSIESALEAASEVLVATPLPRFELAVIGGRLALAPAQPSPGLATALAQVEACVAPLADGPALAAPDRNAFGPEIDDQRLRQLPASPAHRFHVPLTDRIDLGAAFRIRDELASRLGPLLDEPRSLTDLALMGDPGEGRPFRVLQRFELQPGPPRRAAHALPCMGPHTLVPLQPRHPVETPAKTKVAV